MNNIRSILQFFAQRKILAVIAVSIAVGFFLRGGGHKMNENTSVHVHDVAEENTAEVWTCSMHPQIKLPTSGQCPICGMDLIPVIAESGDEELSPRQLKLSAAAIKLAEIQVTPVTRRFVTKEIRMVGKVTYDETRVGYITSWFPGRIDRLFVDYTGIPVKKGDHLAEIYSPDLYTTQEELIQALKAVGELQNSKLLTTRETALLTVESSRKKLRLLGLTDEQIEEFEDRGEPIDHVTLYSPMEGVVIHRNAVEGLYVDTGSRIYTIADLSNVWVLLDVYESDLEWIRYGQKVEFSTEAYPGETFTGKIAFIDPILNDKTRTIKVRVNLPNAEGKLKPDMFVSAVVMSRVALGGKVMDPSLAGKFICPMHPEIVKDRQGTCDICEMPLVKAESLGYANLVTAEPPLVIPVSTPLITGKRAVVYVAVPGKDGVFEGKEVILGPRAGDFYLVEKGLQEGEMVVVNGNFKIDSAVQILAKPSMMSPEGGVVPAGHNHGAAATQMPVMETAQMTDHSGMDMDQPSKDGMTYEVSSAFKKQLDQVFPAYYHIQFALSHDNVANAKEGASHLQMTLPQVDMSLVAGEAHMAWMKELGIIKKNGKIIAESDDIEASRVAFKPLSQSMISVAKMFGTSGGAGTYQFHCPMADNNKGADWLQNKPDLENPFFGSMMFKCGELVETINQ